jgi:hypothetical protein
MELDPGTHIGSTWFVLKTGCDTRRDEAATRGTHWIASSSTSRQRGFGRIEDASGGGIADAK